MKRFQPELDALYSRIFIGAAWPTTRDGFVVVVGEHRTERIGGQPLLVLLDEVTDVRLWDLVVKLAALRDFYHPEHVYADAEHIAAMQFASHWPQLQIEHALLTAMDGPLAYALPLVKRLVDMHRLTLPPASRLGAELLTVPAHDDPGRLKLDDYPGVAALSFAVLALDSSRADRSSQRQSVAETPRSVL